MSRSSAKTLFFWLALCLLGAGLYVALQASFAQLPPNLTEDSNDIATYREAGEAILSGEVPYRDFFIEYPPGSLPAFVPPALLATSEQDYAAFFASEMALVLVASLALTACAARSLGRRWLLPAAVFIAATLLLSPVAVTRYDPIVALTLAAAVALVVGVPASGRSRAVGAVALIAAWASLGLGAAAKLVPALATLPLALLAGRRGGARPLGEMARSAALGFAVFFLVVAVFFLPAYLLGGGGFVESFSYHADRGLQLESLPASALMQLGWLEGTSFEYGAFDVEGRGVELLASMSLPLTGVLLAITATVMYCEYRKGDLGPEHLPRFMAAFVLAFILGSKVLSPQYVIWLLPLVPLSAGGVWGLGVSGSFLAVCWTTALIYRSHYGGLVDFQSPATELLLIRNLLLVALWISVLSLPSGDKRERPANGPEAGPA